MAIFGIAGDGDTQPLAQRRVHRNARPATEHTAKGWITRAAIEDAARRVGIERVDRGRRMSDQHAAAQRDQQGTDSTGYSHGSLRRPRSKTTAARIISNVVTEPSICQTLRCAPGYDTS